MKIILCIALLLACCTVFAQKPAAVFVAGGGSLNTITLAECPDGQYDNVLLDNVPAVMNRSFADNLYFRVNEDIRRTLGHELWIAVHGASDVFAGMRLRYNSESWIYTFAPDLRLLGNGEEETFIFHITDAKFAGGQNGGADFRLETYRFRLTYAEIFTEEPDMKVLTEEERAARIAANIAALPQTKMPDKPMEFVVCGDDGFGRPAREERQAKTLFGTSFDDESVSILKKLGVTSVQCYVPFESIMPRKEGVWEWEPWDRDMKVLEKYDMKYSPFLILGPSYAMPEWYRQTADFQPGVCLEHGESNMVDNIWNPALPKYIDMFLGEFSRHYDHGRLETVLLGITGDYGEAIQPIMGGLAGIEPGAYHGHPGFWCGTQEAQEAFRAWARRKYRYIQLLNKAWNKDYESFAYVDFPARGEDLTALSAGIRDASPAEKREYLDFVTWYRESMNNYAEKWLAAAKEYFADVPVYLCTGGSGEPQHGSDFSLNAKLCGKYGMGIRLTNEGSVYIHNNLATRLLTSAARFYGARYGKEPFGNVSPEGEIARIYGSVTSGCSQHEEYYRNLTDHPDKYKYLREYVPLLERSEPVTPAVLYYPNIACTLDEAPWWPDYENIRYITNCDYADENMLRDGALKDKLIMVMPSTLVEPEDARQIMAWVKDGGILIVMDREPVKDIENTGVCEKIIFPKGAEGSVWGKGYVKRTDDFGEIAGIIDSELEKRGFVTYSSPEHSFFGADMGDRLMFYNPAAKPAEARYREQGKDMTVTVPAYGIKTVRKQTEE